MPVNNPLVLFRFRQWSFQINAYISVHQNSKQKMMGESGKNLEFHLHDDTTVVNMDTT